MNRKLAIRAKKHLDGFATPYLYADGSILLAHDTKEVFYKLTTALGQLLVKLPSNTVTIGGVDFDLYEHFRQKYENLPEVKERKEKRELIKEAVREVLVSDPHLSKQPITINFQNLVGEISVSSDTELTEDQTLKIEKQVKDGMVKAVKCACEAIAEGQDSPPDDLKIKACPK